MDAKRSSRDHPLHTSRDPRAHARGAREPGPILETARATKHAVIEIPAQALGGRYQGSASAPGVSSVPTACNTTRQSRRVKAWWSRAIGTCSSGPIRFHDQGLSEWKN